MKKSKQFFKAAIPLTLSLSIVFGCVLTAGAASYIKGDADGNGKVNINDATAIQKKLAEYSIDPFNKKAADIDGNGLDVNDVTNIQRYLAGHPDPYHISENIEEFDQIYSLNAKLMDGVPGVYEVKAVKGDSLDGENGKTIGIPSVAKQNLENEPTEEAPAIITGAANGFETKTGPVEYTMNEGLAEEDIISPYSKFKHKIIDETVTDADGNRSTHKKLSGYDGTYYIIRVDVSDIINGKTGYLHVRQESNRAMLVQAGMNGGVSTGEIDKNADGTQTEAPHIDAATNHWFVETKDTGIPVGDENQSLSYVDADGIWRVAGTGFVTNAGMVSQVYSLADNAKALKDTDGNYKDKPYIDVIVMSSGKLAAGADAGKENAPGSDIKLSMYVDDVRDYNPELTFDPASTDLNHKTNISNKFYKAESFTADNNATSYMVKGSDLEIDVVTENNGANEYWSLTKAIAYPEYDSHTIKMICEVPVLEGLSVEGADDSPRNVIFDVNSFDIQVANNSTSGAAVLTVKHYATLTITDNSNNSGAELAIGNNASMEIESGGTLIISETCQLEVKYDAATQTQTSEGEQNPASDLTNGVITIHNGGKIINNGVINIEGTEVKPIQPKTQEQEQQQSTTTDMKSSCILIEDGGVLDNYGCLSLNGNLYVMGTVNNYGRYSDVIAAQDPDKGTISYRKGIQLTWKGDVTVLDEATNTYSVNPDVVPGTLFVGKDAEGNLLATAKINNYGDIVLVPGVLNVYATFNNADDPENGGKANLIICGVDAAVVPITPDPNDPTKTQEKRQLLESYPSVLNRGENAVIINNGYIFEANVEVLSNGALGMMIITGIIEI